MSPVATPTVVVPLAVVVPLSAAAVLAAADRHLPGPARDVLGTGAAIATTVLAAVALTESAHQRIVYWFGGWHPVHGTVIGVDYAVDALGGALAVLAGVLAVAALVYSRRFFGPSGGRYPALVLVFLAASIDFAWTGDLFNMFVAFELVAVTGFILTGYYAEREAPLQGAINFAVTNTIGGLLMLTGVVLLYGQHRQPQPGPGGADPFRSARRWPGGGDLRPSRHRIPGQSSRGAVALLAARRLRRRAGTGVRAARRSHERTRHFWPGPHAGRPSSPGRSMRRPSTESASSWGRWEPSPPWSPPPCRSSNATPAA